MLLPTIGRPENGHFPLLETSPAINAGNDKAYPATDQLGQTRIGDWDIGAIEFALSVSVDFKPGNAKNNVNPKTIFPLLLTESGASPADSPLYAAI
jgi:hypothetical protein